MASTTPATPPRHRGGHERRRAGAFARAGGLRARLWTVLAAVVVLGVVLGVVLSARHDRSAEARDPMITLSALPDRDPVDVVAGTLTLTGSCLSLPDGLVVWPQGSTFDPATEVVQVSHPAIGWMVGSSYGLPGTVSDHIPTAPTATLSQAAIDALTACSRSTGIRSVAFVG